MRHLVLFFALVCGGLGQSFADGGTVIAQGTSGPLRVTVFAKPYPLRAGPADLSVLVQNAETDAPILDAEVTFAIAALNDDASDAGIAWVPPCCSMAGPADLAQIPATRQAAQNKLLYSAKFPIPASGLHRITVTAATADGTVSLESDTEIRPPLPPLAQFWQLLALPPLAVGLFAIHSRLRR